jgi:sortase A
MPWLWHSRRSPTRPGPSARADSAGAGAYASTVSVRRVVVVIGRTCIGSGFLILLFVAYQLWGTGLAEARSQDRLRSDFLDALAAAPTAAAGSDAAAEPVAPPPPPLPGDAVALLRIPKIGVEKAVVEGVGVEALKAGPGHYPSTPLPGQPGNSAIAGHRTTYGAPFFRTDELEAGDVVEVTTRQGEFTYRVREKRIVLPSQNEVLAPTEENLLTLTTCNPKYSAAQRLIIISELVGSPAAPAVVPAPATQTEVADARPVETLDDPSVSGDRAARTPALLWGLATALVGILTWALSRRWGRLAAYSMGSPVFLLLLFAFFESFARLLPANV